MRLIVTLLLAAACVCSTAAAAENGSDAIDLFNGKNLDGWSCFTIDPNVKMEDVWSVKDGLLVCKGEPLGYLYTNKDYETYQLVVEWRWAPGKKPGNSGVLLRIAGDPVSFLPKCCEAQLMSGNAGDMYGFHGYSLKGPADRLKEIENSQLGKFVGVTKMKSAEKEPGEWNRYEISADGPTITLVINGQEVNRATDCDVLAGKIGLQSEGAEIHFRKVQLTPTPKQSKQSKQIVLFNGKDLSGWSFRSPDSNAKIEDTFSVKDGVLCCTGTPVGYLQTDKKYTDYALKLEWRWPRGSEPGNNGVLLRVLEGEHFYGNVWPKCIEAQLFHRHAGEILTIGEFPLKGDPDRTEGRHTANAKPCNEKPLGEWNEFEAILQGDRLTLKVNGEVQNVATEVKDAPATIALQSEGAPIEFRNIVLRPLDQ
ncbi:MAG: hypothetical protein A2V70_19505 [Planctomycetes bacterium RBG_13_63_9]|nr:MAG: hypothetical protein A2V70_19505 [Planctomycetes bacterium RBG_13_63_9]